MIAGVSLFGNFSDICFWPTFKHLLQQNSAVFVPLLIKKVDVLEGMSNYI